jgi:hypothetical protein
VPRDAACYARRSLSHVARSVLLTSGTLSPLDSFSGELGLDFHVRLEAPHVVDVNRQVRHASRLPAHCCQDPPHKHQGYSNQPGHLCPHAASVPVRACLLTVVVCCLLSQTPRCFRVL